MNLIDVAATLDQRGRGPTDAVMMNLQVAHALSSEGADASEDGTGRGTPLIVERLDHHRFHCLTCGQWFGVNDYESNTVTCPACGETHIDKIADVLDARAVDVRNLRMQPDGTSGTLQHKKSGGYSLNYQNPILAMAYRTAGNCGPFEQGDKTGALNTATDPSQNIICFSSKDNGADAGEISPTLRAQNFKDSHINGGGQVAIAFTERTRSGGRNLEAQEELAYAVTNLGSGGRTHSRQIAGGFGVRRLTPMECERLQSFPDGWTAIDAEGKEISDSARYRMLGNAVCVNVAEWIGKRIMKVANQ